MKYSLPDSANDLLIKDGKLLMKTLSVYEVLKRFGHIIRLTPFRFEDFTAALLAEEQSPLLAEIHIQLLRTLMREDRQQQTWLGPPDIRDSINIYLHLADHTSWPAAIRLYLSADIRENASILAKLGASIKGICQDEEESKSEGSKNYPFNVNIQVRLEVLEQLCDQFLLSNLAREEIVNGANSIDKHDTVCRSCSKANADLIACSTCPSVYHLKCSDPPLENYPNNDEEPYTCVICRSNHKIGVSDCKDFNEQQGNLKRHEALGVDKLGRRYLFLVRRLFVVDETEEDVRYYTTKSELDEIIESLNSNRHEKSLIDNLLQQREEIERQMQITEDLYQTLMKDHKNEDGTYSQFLGQDGAHKTYVNHYSSSNLAVGKNQHSDRDVNRSLNNKFSMNSLNSFKWIGSIDGQLTTLTVTIRTTILKFEALLPQTFVHPCWQSQRTSWIKLVNYAQHPQEYAIALAKLESCIRPVLFKSAWYDSVGFFQLFRSTLNEREELKKTDRQPRGFERREWFNQDFELSYRLGTMVKFSPKLKPVKHQVWKQKGEEYRLTGLNAWYWQGSTYKPGTPKPKSRQQQTILGAVEKFKTQQATVKKCVFARPKLPPCHDFLTKQTKKRSILVLPGMELRKLARSGGLREAKSFSYTAKQSNQVWPYGMTPRPTFRTCWLYKNRVIDTIQDVALQLKVIYGCLRWEDLQVKSPAAGHKTIVTDESTITIELLKKRDKLPYLTHSEYLIRKKVTPIEQPTKYRKIGTKKTTPSARSGLRARRQTVEEEEKGPTTEEIWVTEDQLELWELRQFDEKIIRQNQLLRERALREEAERRKKAEEERRRKAEQERRRRAEEEAKRARLAVAEASSATTPSNNNNNNNIINVNTTPTQQQSRSLPTTPVLRYFRTEQGQIIRLPASYLQRGTPLILRHVGPGPNQTNTYIIRPQIECRSSTGGGTNQVTNASSTGIAPTTTTINTATTTTTTTTPNATTTTGAPTSSINATTTNNHAPSTAIASITTTNATTTTPDATTTAPEPTTTTSAPTTTTNVTTTVNTVTTATEATTTTTDATTTNTNAPSAEIASTNTTTNATNDQPATSEAPMLAQAESSVGTVVNEMAHDRHAPAAPVAPAQTSLDKSEG